MYTSTTIGILRGETRMKPPPGLSMATIKAFYSSGEDHHEFLSTPLSGQPIPSDILLDPRISRSGFAYQ